MTFVQLYWTLVATTKKKDIQTLRLPPMNGVDGEVRQIEPSHGATVLRRPCTESEAYLRVKFSSNTKDKELNGPHYEETRSHKAAIISVDINSDPPQNSKQSTVAIH